MNLINVYNISDKKYLPKKILVEVCNSILADFNIHNMELGIILCDDKKILEINTEFLNHNYTTDVITFEIEEEPYICEIYISVDTAERQADEYEVSLKNEILRLALHGVLHIVGYDDENDDKRLEMKMLEDKYLNEYYN